MDMFRSPYYHVWFVLLLTSLTNTALWNQESGGRGRGEPEPLQWSEDSEGEDEKVKLGRNNRRACSPVIKMSHQAKFIPTCPCATTYTGVPPLWKPPLSIHELQLQVASMCIAVKASELRAPHLIQVSLCFCVRCICVSCPT